MKTWPRIKLKYSMEILVNENFWILKLGMGKSTFFTALAEYSKRGYKIYGD